VTTYHVRAADEHDVDAVLALRRHAEDWLREAGIGQWTKSEYGARVIKGWIGANSTFVVSTDDGEVIGSLSLDAGDPDFWTPEELRAPALYLYKFIIRSDHRGNGLGDVLLDWCGYRTELAGDLYLRLDCWRDNAGLHKYLDRGFHYLTTRSHPTRMSGALFERPAEVRLATKTEAQLIDHTLGGEPFPPVRDGSSNQTTAASLLSVHDQIVLVALATLLNRDIPQGSDHGYCALPSRKGRKYECCSHKTEERFSPRWGASRGGRTSRSRLLHNRRFSGDHISQ
jgi:GNAT superfamily N-acetyltransferase